MEQYTIVHRTTWGKKHRLTPVELELFGALLDTPPPEDDADTKKEMYGQLKYARTFVANKLSDIARVYAVPDTPSEEMA